MLSIYHAVTERGGFELNESQMCVRCSKKVGHMRTPQTVLTDRIHILWGLFRHVRTAGRPTVWVASACRTVINTINNFRSHACR